MTSLRRTAGLAAALARAVFFLFVALPAAHPAPFGRKVEAVTGAHTRVVWMRDTRKDKAQKYGSGDRFVLMGFDSRDGRGVRTILDEEGSYYRPLITPDGRRIVFTDTKEGAVYVVGWDGAGRRRVSDGIAGALWQDPQGEIWIHGKASAEGYSYGVAGQHDRRKHGDVIRYPLDDPQRIETVWSKSPGEIINPGNLQLSAGGDAGSMTMPWPASGIAKFPDLAWIQQANGCWPSLAPDRSYLSWTFDGSHRSLAMFDPFSRRSWKIDLSRVPGIGGGRVYHPRWSNHAMFITFTGPYSEEGKMVSPWPDIYLAKFRGDFSGIESSINVTRSKHVEIFPDLWVKGGRGFSSASSKSGPYPSALPGEKWPVSKDGLLFLWKNSRLGNTPAQEVMDGQSAVAMLSGEACFGPDHELVLRNGSARVEGFDRKITDRIAASDAFSLEFVLAVAGSDQSGLHRLVTLSRGGRDTNFSVCQLGGKLVLFLRGSKTAASGREVQLCALEPGRKTHVVVAYSQGLVGCYVDGIKSLEIPVEAGSLAGWDDGAKLVFGEFDPAQYSGWSGSLEGVAVYDRALSADEVHRNAGLFHEILRQRPKRESWEVEAELVTRRPAPDPADVAPYRRALVVNRYKLTQGQLPGLSGDEICVAEWALLDGREPQSYREHRTGLRRRLRLERFDDHPQLQSERLISEPDELDLFVEAVPWQR